MEDVEPANVPSQRVLEKVDFTYVRDAEWYGMTMRELRPGARAGASRAPDPAAG